MKKEFWYILVPFFAFCLLIAGIYTAYSLSDPNEYRADSEKGYWRMVLFPSNMDPDVPEDCGLAVVYQGNDEGNAGENIKFKWYLDNNRNQCDYSREGEIDLYERQHFKYYLWNSLNKKNFYWLQDEGIDTKEVKKVTMEIEWTENKKRITDNINMKIN